MPPPRSSRRALSARPPAPARWFALAAFSSALLGGGALAQRAPSGVFSAPSPLRPALSRGSPDASDAPSPLRPALLRGSPDASDAPRRADRDPPAGVGVASSFTCVHDLSERGSCFVADCAQLRGALNAGVAHVTLFANLSSSQSACAFPLVVRRPLTIRGACGDPSPSGGENLRRPSPRCVIDGGGVVTREPAATCRQQCASCDGGGAPVFDVRRGGALTLVNLEIRNACNKHHADGAGGAIVVRSGVGSFSSREADNDDSSFDDGLGSSSDASSPRDGSVSCSAGGARGGVSPPDPDGWREPSLPSFAPFADGPFDDDRPPSDPPSDASSRGFSTLDAYDPRNASLTAVNVLVRDCVAYGGAGNDGRGGAFAIAGSRASARFADCAFEGNEAWGAASAAMSYDANLGEGGAAAVADGASASFRRCRFARNVAEMEGGAVTVSGGATVAFDACEFANNTVWDDYKDGGGALFASGANTRVSVEVTKFSGNEVRAYPDARRRALSCGGGAAALVEGATARFRFALFEENRAPRGGAVCAHDAEARFDRAVFRGNRARHEWFGRAPGDDVECVQCFEWGGGGGGDDDESAVALGSIPASLDRCAYRTNDDATGWYADRGGARRPTCAPPPGAFGPARGGGGGGGGEKGGGFFFGPGVGDERAGTASASASADAEMFAAAFGEATGATSDALRDDDDDEKDDDAETERGSF